MRTSFTKKNTKRRTGDHNVFSTPQFNRIWFWLHYTISPRLKISVSPFGYFESYVLNTKLSDANIQPVKEFRFAARLENEYKGSILNYSNRYNLEYRLRDLKNNGIYQPNWRIRYMAKIEKPVKGIFSKQKPVTFTLYDEIFLQFGKAVKSNPSVFDQNRIYIGASYEVLKNVRCNIGYIYGYQERPSGDEFDNINTFWIVLTLDNFITQFIRHKN